MRARFDQRQKLKNEYELLIKFDEHTYDLFGLYQQAIVGDINVPKMNYRDPNEMSYMWSWIKGNRKWHAWNKCKDDAMCLYVDRMNELEKELDRLIDDWKDELDPRVPDKNAWIPEEEAEEFQKLMEQAKLERRFSLTEYYHEAINSLTKLSIYN
uniref:ACB domain-containing protein n=1 Tax=Elaeophora elaphi TaxID=1147741 RepID=A0A0R3RHT2_9BILA